MAFGDIEISVIIVNFNGRQFLPAAVRAIQDNTVCQKTEVIIVDGGSNDGSAEGLPKGKLPVRVIYCGENVGFCRGNNIGVSEARGRVVVFTQGDGELQPGWDTPLLEALEEKGVVVVGGLVLKVGSPEVIFSAGMAIAPNVGAWDLCEWMTPEDAAIKDSQNREVVCISPSFLMVRREDHFRAGGFWETLFVFGDEADYGLRMRKLGRAVLCPASRMLHWGGGTCPPTSPLRLKLASRNRILDAARHLPLSRLVWALMLTASFDALELGRLRNREITKLILGSWVAGLREVCTARALSTREDRAHNVQYLSTMREYMVQRKERITNSINNAGGR